MSATLLSGPNDTGPEAYAFEQCVPGLDVIFAKTTLRASEVKARLRILDPRGVTRGEVLTLYADTFILDDPVFLSPIITIVARVIDLTKDAVPIFLSNKSRMPVVGVQVVAQSVINGTLTIHTRAGTAWTPHWQQFQGRGPESLIFWDTGDARFPIDALVESFDWPMAPLWANAIIEIARRPQVWNTLKSQFALACLLADDPLRKADAASMLQWIIYLTKALASKPGPLLAEACQLNHQASALMLFNTAAGARYVPVWSEAYIHSRIDGLLGVLGGYEEKVRTLEVREDLQRTVESLSKALRDVSTADLQAIEVAVRINSEEIAAQVKQYEALRWAYEMQTHAVSLSLIIFKGGLAESATIRMTTAILGIVGSVVQMGAAAYGAGVPDPAAANAAAQSAAKQGKEAADGILDLDKIVKEAIKSEVLGVLKKLKAHLELSMKIGKAAGEALSHAEQISKASGMDTRGTIELPELAEMSALDPELEWNIFIQRIEVMLREFINGDKDNSAVKGAKEYYISLCTLAEYGRALSLKTVTLARLQSRALELAAQRNAASFAIARWEALHTEAKTAEEKLSLCRALLLQAALNTKRSLLIMAEGYRAAHAYNRLAETPLKLRLTMDHAGMNEEFRSLKNDIASLFIPPAHMQEITTDFFDVPVIPENAKEFPSMPHAVLRTSGGGKPTLTWTTSLADPPFANWLSSGRRSVYFVEEARFYLEGAEADAAGFINMRVSTTGQYENGHGAPPSARFVSQGLPLDFGYETKNTDAPYARWRPVGRTKDNYMSPTPFTTWHAVIERSGSLTGLKKIRMKLWLLRQDAP